jgi:type I restriction enzyme S subunit
MQSGFACARKHSDPVGLPHIRPFNIGMDGELDFSQIIRIPFRFREDFLNFALRPGDVLFNNTNSVELVGKTAIVREPLECAFSNHITRLQVCAPHRLNPQWLALALRLLQSQGYFAQRCNKWIGQAGFNPTKLSEVLIPLPALDIQRRIVARIEALLAELKEMRDLAAAIRRDTDRVMEAALEEVFGLIRRGFEVTGIPQDQIKSIEKVAQLERGKFTHRPRNDRQFFGGTIPWVQIQNIPKDYSKYITDYMDTLNERGLAISKLFPTGTLVVSIAATIGAVGILQFDAGFPDSLVGITADPSQVEPGFLYWQLCYLREHLETIAPAAAQKNINLQIFRDCSSNAEFFSR